MEAARAAQAADLADIAELCRHALAEAAGGRGGLLFGLREARGEPVLESLEHDLADPGTLLLAGTYEDMAVGYAAATIETLRDGSKLAVVSDLYVRPEARQVGVGDALMSAVLAWADEQGCAGADGLALPGDRHTKNFFEAHGFTARLLVVHRALKPAEPL